MKYVTKTNQKFNIRNRVPTENTPIGKYRAIEQEKKV